MVSVQVTGASVHNEIRVGFVDSTYTRRDEPRGGKFNIIP